MPPVRRAHGIRTCKVWIQQALRAATGRRALALRDGRVTAVEIGRVAKAPHANGRARVVSLSRHRLGRGNRTNRQNRQSQYAHRYLPWDMRLRSAAMSTLAL